MIKKLFFTVALLTPCLAHANIPPFVSSFSGQIVPATPTCQLGNHGLVRGRPIIAHGTILAEDGCPLRGAIDEGQSICVGYSDLNWYKNSQSVINLNAIVGGWPIQDPFCGGVQTLAQIYAVIDAQLSNVS